MPEKDRHAEASALYQYVRDTVRYVMDIHDVETIATPDKTLSAKIGDCDDQSTLLATLLESVGYPTRFVVSGYVTKNPEHVYLQVLVDGDWFDCDPTEHQYFGWAPPNPTIVYIENV
jgi:transglutaminase-like putative cysteine protease